MTYRLILNTLVLFLLASCNKTKTENDLTKKNLKGKVKSITEITYEAIERFGEIEKGEKKGDLIGHKTSHGLDFIHTYKKETYNEDGNKADHIVYSSETDSVLSMEISHYDERGVLTEKDSYGSDGDFRNKTKYKYDEKRSLIEENVFSSDGESYEKSTYKYDEQNNLIELIQDKLFEGLFRNTYKYDERNNRIESKSFYEGSMFYKTISEYGEKDNLIQENGHYYNNEGEINMKTISKYNENGSPIEEEKYEYEKLTSKKTYKYDEKSNLIEENQQSSDGDLRKSTYEYIYDDEGNWIERIQHYYFNDILPEITERKIEYY